MALSPALCEVLPNIPHPPSPFLELLAPKMMLDVWGGDFVPDAKRLERYKSYGIDELAIIKHVWQRYGYDIKLPDHLPANPGMGGDEGMKVLVSTATKLGYVFSLHENYIDFYPNAPSWNEKDVVRTPSGEMSKAWYHKGTKTQSYAIKANKMLYYAAQNSPEIHRRFGTNASYLDVHSCVTPWHHVDYEAEQPGVSVAAICRRHDIVTSMVVRWRAQFGFGTKERAKLAAVTLGGGQSGASSAPVVLHDLLQPPGGMTAVELADGRRVFAPKDSDPDAVLRHVLEQEAAR